MTNMINYIRKLSCILLLTVTLPTIISAASETTYIYEYPEQNTTIEFSDSSLLASSTRQTIADSIVYSLPLSQTYSLCWLVGHDTITETITATYHKRSQYEPRCQLEIYHVTSCTNCDYANPVLVSSKYISCCPPEASAVSLD